MSGYPKYTTPSSQQSSGSVTITHPYHPLHGQQVELVRVRHGVDPDLIVRLPDGRHAAISMYWTDYAGQLNPAPRPIPTHLLDLEGLRQVIQFIDRIRQASSRRTADDGARLAHLQPDQ
ncbi:MAG: Y4bD/Y4pK family protein [Chloroflexi bacterium]|nr:Y4bD/Y4pK family protein [Chloroflexota bacterium]